MNARVHNSQRCVHDIRVSEKDRRRDGGDRVLVGMPRGAEAQGQAIDGIIEGIVRAQAGDSPVAGANVRAFNTGTAYERAVTTDESGRYSLPLLPPGEYVVFVEAPTFAAMSQTGVHAARRAGDDR